MNIRIGSGYDVHRLKAGRDLWLGGISIPHDKGTLGHSDGDVLIHAVCDALLGALDLGDIGIHFPDSSDEFRDIRSTILLERTYHMVREKKYALGNLDSTVILEKPKIRDYIPQMKDTLAGILHTSPSNISIKATTSEKMGFIGRGKGVAAYATVLLRKVQTAR
jgi:2-C-methyl-D-erythritol 2,4-cyclodiphosphate synthase